MHLESTETLNLLSKLEESTETSKASSYHYAAGNERVAPGKVLIIYVNVIVLFIDFVQRRVLLKR